MSHAADYSDEERAHELYLDGVEKLDAGHRDFAQRTFEQVIALYPDAPAAGLARRQLADLYRGATPPEGGAARADVPATEPPTTTGAIAAPAVADTSPVLLIDRTRNPAWEQELKRTASVQARLRSEAGDRVFFSAGSAELGSRARMALAAQAQWLLRQHELEAAIEGHADEPGSDEENIRLSARRAEVVRHRLIEEGVEARRLTVLPLGRTVRVAVCSDPDCRAQNRRAVTLVLSAGAQDRLGFGGDQGVARGDPPVSPALVPARHVDAPLGDPEAGVPR